MKAATFIAICLIALGSVVAAIPERDQAPARTPRPNVAGDFVSVREADRNKPGEKTIRELLVRNHHLSRSIRVSVGITWQETARSQNLHKDSVITLKPGEEKSAHWFYPVGHGIRDSVWATIDTTEFR